MGEFELIRRFFRQAQAEHSATGVLLETTMLQVLFGELMPKSAALRQSAAVGLGSVLPMQW